MIISDLNYLETLENSAVEGSGYADFAELFSLTVNAQRLALANVSQIINVQADVFKSITFLKTVSARAEV